MNDPRRTQRPLVFGPGGLGVSQLPTAADDVALANLQSLESRKLDSAAFPLGGLAASGSALYGALLVWDGAHWVDRNWVPRLGVGSPPGVGATFTVSGITVLQGAVNAAGELTLGTVLANTVTVTGATVLRGPTTAGSLTADTTFLSTLTVSGSTKLVGPTNAGSLTAGPTTLNSATITGALVVLGAINAGATTLSTLTANSATVTGAVQILGPSNLGALSAGAARLSSLTVTGATQLLGATNSGDLIAGNVTASTLWVTGATSLSGVVNAYQNVNVSGTVTVSPIGARCMTLNHALGFGGATIKLQPASGVNRVILNVGGLFQMGTDLSFNGGTDFFLQSLTTGNAVLAISGTDLVTLGSSASAGGVLVGVAGGKAGLYGTGPILQQAQTVDLRQALVNFGLYTAPSGPTPLNLNSGKLTAGTLAVTGHLDFSGGFAPTAVSGTAMGANALNPTVAAGSTDTRGRISFTTGTGPTAGQQVKITYAQTYATAPFVFVQMLDNVGGSLGCTVGDRLTTGCSLYTQVAPAAATAYQFFYWIIQ